MSVKRVAMSLVVAIGLVFVVGCGGSDDDNSSNTSSSSSSGASSAKSCGAYNIEIYKRGMDQYLRIENLFGPGWDYDDMFYKYPTSSSTQAQPSGWTSTVAQSVNGQQSDKHTLRFQNVSLGYSVSFNLTIDGQYSCSWP